MANEIPTSQLETSRSAWTCDARSQPALRILACGSVSVGKTTLVQRLLCEGRLIHEGRPKALGAEREHGATTDIPHFYFATPKCTFIIADAPGHEKHTHHLATEGSKCDLAILLVNARKGLLTPTFRQAVIVSLLGIRHVILAVNKIDLIEFDQAAFEAIKSAFDAFAKQLGFQSIIAIPISARYGDNLSSKSTRTPWFKERPLFETIEDIDIGSGRESPPFRMPVREINCPHPGFCDASGTVASGAVQANDEIVAAQSGRISSVQRIVTVDGDLAIAREGDAVTLTLSGAVDITRGDILAALKDRPSVADQFAAHLIWMSDDPLLPGRSYLLKIGTQTVPASVTKLKHRLDVSTLAAHAAKTLTLNEVAFCNIATSTPVAFDPFEKNRSTGAFTLIDRMTNETAAAGTISFALRRAANVHRQNLAVTKLARAQLKQQNPAILWFTGLPGAGKSTIANLVEAHLHALGVHTIMLDGDNVRHGLSKDLGFTDADRVENIRRVGEVAKLMTEAGLIVLCSFISPFRAERRMLREMVGAEFIEVFVDTPLETCIARDPKGLYKRAIAGEIKNFTGIDQAYETPQHPEVRLTTTQEGPEGLARRVIDELRARKVL